MVELGSTVEWRRVVDVSSARVVGSCHAVIGVSERHHPPATDRVTDSLRFVFSLWFAQSSGRATALATVAATVPARGTVFIENDGHFGPLEGA